MTAEPGLEEPYPVTVTWVPTWSSRERWEEIEEVFFANGKYANEIRHLQTVTRVGLLSVAVVEQQVVGAMTCIVWSSVETATYNRLLLPDQHISSDPPSLHLLDVAVAPLWQGQGVGTHLIRDTVELARWGTENKQPFTRVFAESRRPRNGGPSSVNCLLRLGFLPLLTTPRAYEDDHEFECPICGDYCSCDRVLMFLERDCRGPDYSPPREE